MKPILSIIVPCLNEKKTIIKVLTDAHYYAQRLIKSKYEIIVADNGSTDGTLQILKKEKFIKVVNVPIRGYGAALHWGILSSSGKYALFADADLSYPFSNLNAFLATFKQYPDVVLGSRIKGTINPGAMPFLNRYLGTPILTLLIRLIYKIPTSDCNSGMRLIKIDFYKKLNMRNSGMEWASELLIKTALHKGKYLEVPIVFNKDGRTNKPHLSRWTDGWRHFKAILLLKPKVLHIVLYFFMLLFALVLPYSFSMAFFFYMLFIILLLGVFTLNLLKFIIEGEISYVSKTLIQSPLVFIALFITLILLIALKIIPDEHLGTKMFLISTLAVIYMWLFLVETIKTHLVNPLPKSLFTYD